MYTATLTDRGPIVVERTFMAPRAKVWKALTDPAQMRVWYFPQLEDFRAETGFETEFVVSHGGKEFIHQWRVTEVVPKQKISYEWKFAGYPGCSLLTIELFEQLGVTWLRLTHAGTDSFRGDLLPDLAKENFINGWRSFIGGALRDYLKA
jgi:uncharacterized protein YndB with AHSA1/START domain